MSATGKARASDGLAAAQALAHFTRGLALLQTLPPTSDRDRQELSLQIALFTPLAAVKGYGTPEVGRAYARARELCAELDDLPRLFQVLYGLWGHNLVRMELKTARALAQQCLELARRIQDPALLLEANRMVGETAFHRGMLGEAREYLERSRTLYDPRQHRAHAALYGQDPGVALLAHGSLTLWHLGHPDQALKWSQEALAQAQDASHPFSMVFALEYASILHQLRGEGEAALERAEAAIALSGEQRFGMWLAMAGILRAWALVERGEAAAGIAGIRQGLADYRDRGSELFTPYFLTLLARALRRVGESEAALDALDEALQTGERTEGRVWEAECYRVKGELLQEAPAGAVSGRDRGDAEASLRQAVAVARQHGARSLELRAAMTLCTTWSRQGKKADARQLLAEPYRWFTEGFGTADLRQAASLLESVSA